MNRTEIRDGRIMTDTQPVDGRLDETTTVFDQLTLLERTEERLLYGALFYSQLGMPVFPVRIIIDARGKQRKVPCVKNWPEVATTDPGLVTLWWSQEFSGALIGVVTGQRSGWGVLDVDVKNGAPGFTSLTRLADELVPIQTTAELAFGQLLPEERLRPAGIVRTMNGGLHLWYRLGDQRQTRGRNRVRGLPGLEFKATGHYVVAAPSAGYEWVKQLPVQEKGDLTPEQRLAEAPLISEHLLSRLLDGTDDDPGDHGTLTDNEGRELKHVRRGQGGELLAEAVRVLMTTPEGDGNNTVFRVSCDLLPYVALGELTRAEVDRAIMAGIRSWRADEDAMLATVGSAWRITSEHRVCRFTDEVLPRDTIDREISIINLSPAVVDDDDDDDDGDEEPDDHGETTGVAAPAAHEAPEPVGPEGLDDDDDDDDVMTGPGPRSEVAVVAEPPETDATRTQLFALFPSFLPKTEDNFMTVARRATGMVITSVARRVASTITNPLEPPPPQLTYSLAVAGEVVRTPRDFYVDQVFSRRHLVTLVGRYKSGKTTLAGNLVRCLADGEPFLGNLEVTRPDGRIGMWNGEMDPRDFDDYLLGMKVRDARRIVIVHLQGYRINLLSDDGKEWAVNWLRDHEVEVWVPDPWSKICSWSGVDENDNTGVKQLQVRIEEVRREAGVTSVFMPVHPPRAEDGRDGGTPRARGASAMDEWPDALWTYSRDDDQRYLRVEGRGGVGLPETPLVFDEVTRQLTMLTDVTRRDLRQRTLADRILEVVTDNDGLITSEIYTEVGGDRNDVATALQRLEADRRIWHEPGDRARSKRWHVGPGLPRWSAGGVG